VQTYGIALLLSLSYLGFCAMVDFCSGMFMIMIGMPDMLQTGLHCKLYSTQQQLLDATQKYVKLCEHLQLLSIIH